MSVLRERNINIRENEDELKNLCCTVGLDEREGRKCDEITPTERERDRHLSVKLSWGRERDM